ncbi:MAG TPA: HAD family hydrolase [Methylovirgula sp.]|nr:HAD family hydrolase [Methylovirgula sp.]
MHFVAFATDYDGTLAHDGIVADATLEALQRLKDSGRKLILVTGRELPDLKSVFPEFGLFDRIVGENGALLYTPKTGEERLIAPPPDERLIDRLRAMRIKPLSIGRGIIATHHPHEETVLAAIRDLGLELQIIFNKGAVMILPAGVNKASGLRAALEELSLSPINAIGCGDAENDHAFLKICGCSVAVANALPRLKEEVDVVTRGDHGAGIVEIAERLLRNEALNVARHRIVFGADDEGQEATLSIMGGAALIAGPSGGGKSRLATSLLESIAEHGFQTCVIDPEGDYDAIEEAIVLGEPKAAPTIAEILDVLRKPSVNVVANLLGLERADRPAFFLKLLEEILKLRKTTGRPHWLLIDEAHHVLPPGSASARPLPRELPDAIMVTVHPDTISRDALDWVDSVLAVGDEAPDALRRFCRTLDERCPALPEAPQVKQEALFWHRGDDEVRLVSVKPTRLAHRRHIRKYAEGDLGDKSFYFRGPKGALNLRAQNLILFLQLADGVDEATWLHHLKAGDYSAWIRSAIRDEALAKEIHAIEKDAKLPAAESRARVNEAISQRYTAPSEEGGSH